MTDNLPADAKPNEASSAITIDTVFVVIMMVLSLIGAGVTLADVGWAEKYWLTLVPVFGLICIFVAWTRTRSFDGNVLRQVLHWLSVALIIAANFSFFRRTGEQTSIATGLSTLLILSLGCLLAGVHLEWTFALVGILLLAIAIAVSVAQEYMALVLLIGVVLIALVLVGHRFMKKWVR